MNFPAVRLRRLRQTAALRALVRETELSVSHLVQPYFVRAGRNIRKPIGSMPGQFQLSVDQLIREATEAARCGVPAVILFGIPDRKDAQGSGAFAAGHAIAKRRCPEILIFGHNAVWKICDCPAAGNPGSTRQVFPVLTTG